MTIHKSVVTEITREKQAFFECAISKFFIGYFLSRIVSVFKNLMFIDWLVHSLIIAIFLTLQTNILPRFYRKATQYYNNIQKVNEYKKPLISEGIE